tara:strand:- start:2818 stop:3039 length:222 start_codon:yes stop_codon:yes gene_type:complete
MFTVQFDQDETEIIIMDTTGELEDVQALLYDDYCHIRQWNLEVGGYEYITMSTEMYYKLMQAWQSPEGAYILK